MNRSNTGSRIAAYWRLALLATMASTILIAALLAEPVAQDPLYHLFADTRAFAGLPNFQNVASNLPFLLVGSAGVLLILRNGTLLTLQPRRAWLVFFWGIALTAFGSGYYHLSPADGPLVWDRLPMTVGFMGLVAIIIAEYFSASAGRKLLLPLLAAGVGSVLYWSYTESLGRGDLRPYAVVQFLPMLLIPLTISLYRSRSDLSPYFAWMIVFYVASKLAEHYDAEIYDARHVISGHALKHLIASLAPASLLFGLSRRRREINCDNRKAN